MKTIRTLLAVLASVALAACASAPAPKAPPPRAQEVFLDSAFQPPSVAIDPQKALELSPAMRQFADTKLVASSRRSDPRRELFSALYNDGLLQLDYDAQATRTAAEAFEARQGNCMSLVLMTAALARHLGIPVRFNSVFVEDNWIRSRGLYWVSGHVNISLGKSPDAMSKLQMVGEPELLTIDFLPPEQSSKYRSHTIDESTLIAMFANNRAAESLAAGQLDDAYWWARAAIQTDPRWLSSYNTLAVLYRRKGLSSAAESTLRLVLEREPLNDQALSNLVIVLKDAGRADEAQVYSEQLAQIRPVPPYHYFDLGMEAMRKNDYATARQLFRKEIARAAYVSEFHFWLGVASYRLGDLTAARGEIEKALAHSSTTADREIYGAKLAWLDQQRRRN